MIYDCIIIGAGPAGLMAGSQFKNRKVAILEGESKAGQKLLLSGGGQCNFTHGGENKDMYDRYGDKGKFVRKSISAFTNKDVVEYFNNLQIKSIEREDGKIFPSSLDAWDIFRALRDNQSCAELHLDSKVQAISKSVLGFEVKTSKNTFQSKTVLIAAGGASYPMTGSDGSGFKLSENLGHTIVPVKPALTPVYIEGFNLVALAGNAFRSTQLTLWRQGKKIGTYRGDVLVTHTGLSGPGILDNSRDMEAGDMIKLSIMDADKSLENMEKDLLEGRKKLVKTIVANYMTKRTADVLLKCLGIDLTQFCAELSKKDRKKLLVYTTEFPLTIKKMGNLKSAMTTAGGVSTKEVSANTMASKCFDGLYFAGEVLDVDGDSGGYNIQWAFSSGVKAAQSIEAYLNKNE